MRRSVGLTSRLRASSRALDLECLIGRGAVHIPCVYSTVGLVDWTTAKSGWETWRAAERRRVLDSAYSSNRQDIRSRAYGRHDGDWLIC